jgi:L-asparaginase II
VQQLIRSKIAHLVGIQPGNIPAAVDGCGVPVFYVPLKNLAAAYARLAAPFLSQEATLNPEQQAVVRLMNAVRAYPEMVAGDERICTDIMRALGHAIFAKTGAEGGYALTLFDRGWGIALKIDDGSQRALGPVIIEMLDQLGVLTGSQREALKNYHHPMLTNHRKETVGELRAVCRLCA